MARERQQTIKLMRNKLNHLAAAVQEQERVNDTGWIVYDAPLARGEKSFNHYFKGVLPPEYKDIKDYVEAREASRKGAAIGLEIGGPGSNLFAGFSPHFFNRTLGTTVRDVRKPEEILRDQARHHTVLETDVFATKGQRAITNWLAGERADLVIERMWAGLKGFPENPLLLHLFLDRLYRLLNDNGILFAELPRIFGPPNAARILTGLEKIKAQHPAVDMAWHDEQKNFGEDRFYTHIVLRVEKKDGAPPTLTVV